MWERPFFTQGVMLHGIRRSEDAFIGHSQE